MSKLATFSNKNIRWHKYLGNTIIKANNSRKCTKELQKQADRNAKCLPSTPCPLKSGRGPEGAMIPHPRTRYMASPTTCLPEELQRHLGIKSICANSRKWAICVLTNKPLPRFIRVTSGSLSS